MCFDLRFGDEVVRMCLGARGTDGRMRGVTSTSGNDGTVYHYRPLLKEEPSLSRTYTLAQATSQAATLNGISVPSSVVDGLAILRRGRMLAGFGEVSLQWDGMDHDERMILMRGDMDGGVQGGPVGDSSEFLTTSLSDPKATADVNLTPWVVDADRWPNHEARFAGRRYPLAVIRYSDIPALYVDTVSYDWLVCYGHGWTISTSTGVKVNGEPYTSADAKYAWSQQEIVDAFGVPVTVIRFTAAALLDGSEAIHVTVTGDKFADNLIGALDFIAGGFTVNGVAGLNPRLFAEAMAKLGNTEARLLANASGGSGAATALQFLEGGVLQGWPQVSMVYSNGGYGPVVTDRRAAAKTSLTAGTYPLAGKALRWSEGGKASIHNDFVVRYGFDVLGNAYTGVATRHAGNSDLCRLIEEWVGKRTRAPIESPYMFTQAVAETVADWMVDHLLLPPLYIEYPCVPWLALELERGDNVDLTDERFGWTDARATVRTVTLSRPVGTIGLYVWERYYQIGGASLGRYIGSAN